MKKANDKKTLKEREESVIQDDAIQKNITKDPGYRKRTTDSGDRVRPKADPANPSERKVQEKKKGVDRAGGEPGSKATYRTDYKSDKEMTKDL